MSDRNQKIQELRKNDHQAFRLVLKMAFDKNLGWDLPYGMPPVDTIPSDNADMALYQETPKLCRFHRGHYPQMNKLKKEEMFVSMLSTLATEDVVVVCATKDKKLHHAFPGIDPILLHEALPGVFDGIQIIDADPIPVPVPQIQHERPHVQYMEQPQEEVGEDIEELISHMGGQQVEQKPKRPMPAKDSKGRFLSKKKESKVG